MLRGPRQAGSVYDPAAGIFAGAAVGAATGVGISPNPRAAGYEEQAAQGIFQLTKIHPGPPWWAELKTPSKRFAAVQIKVPVDGAVGGAGSSRRTRLRDLSVFQSGFCENSDFSSNTRITPLAARRSAGEQQFHRK